MYPPVSRYEGDPSTVDADKAVGVPGARRSLLLADRESGARLEIAVFESFD